MLFRHLPGYILRNVKVLFEEHLRIVKVKAPGTSLLTSSAFHKEWAAKMEKFTFARITFDYIEFIPKILEIQEMHRKL